MNTSACRLLVWWIVALAAASVARGQEWPCQDGWAGRGLRGVGNVPDSEPVRDLKWWDPDGLGPQRAIAVIAGMFQQAGTLTGSSLVGYDVTTRRWRHVTSPILGTVNAVYPMEDGRLAAAGNFSGSGLPSSTFFAIWDGERWTSDSQGLPSTVSCIARFASGEFVVGASRIMRRTPSGWVAMHGSEVGGAANILKIDSRGRLFAGGSLSVNDQYGVGMWDGTSWTNVYPSLDSDIGLIEPLPDGCMLFGRRIPWFTITSPGIAKWCDGQLTDLTRVQGPEGPANGYATGALVMEDGRVIVQTFVVIYRGYSPSLQLELRGNAWSEVTRPGLSATKMLQTGNDSFLYNRGAGRGVTERVSSLSHSLGNGLDYAVSTLNTLTDGRVMVGGGFVVAGDTPLKSVAMFDGQDLLPLGGGLSIGPRTVLELGDGSMLVGGVFDSFVQDGEEVPSPRVARWDGQRWHAMGIADVGRVRKLFRSAAGDIFALGDSSAASGTSLRKWNGQTWVAISVPTGLTQALAIVQQADGSVLACDSYSGAVFRWDGTQWTSLATRTWPLYAYTMIQLPDGDLLIGTGQGTLTRLDLGSRQWTDYLPWLNGTFEALELLPRPDGGVDVLVGGGFTSSIAGVTPNIARWVPETNQWFPVGTGANAMVRAIKRLSNGEIIVGGDFTLFDGKAAAYLVRHRVACRADFTCDSVVDGDDVIGFFDSWDQGLRTADFDGDGVLSPDDITMFFTSWDAGC